MRAYYQDRGYKIVLSCSYLLWSAMAFNGVKISAEGLMSDIHGSSDYRANLIMVMAQRAITESK